MATIRFIREDLEVQCNPGENLRELVMKENLQLYGLKGILGNCGGAGQCSTCQCELSRDAEVREC